MGIFSSIQIASTGLSAQRLRSDVIADNISNASTTRTPEGGPYRRSRIIMQSRTEGPTWHSPFFPAVMDNGPGKGVKVMEIQKDFATKKSPSVRSNSPRCNYIRSTRRIRRNAQRRHCHGNGRYDSRISRL